MHDKLLQCQTKLYFDQSLIKNNNNNSEADIFCEIDKIQLTQSNN